MLLHRMLCGAQNRNRQRGIQRVDLQRMIYFGAGEPLP